MILSDDPAQSPSEGWAAVPNWLVRNPAIPSPVKLVYLVLSSRAGRNGVCFPSQGLIASETGLSDSTVKRAISSMKRMGLLTVTVQTTQTGRRNIYRIHAHPHLESEGGEVSVT